ncbi:MAG: hypothetical protein JST42_17270, partial [Bacteroidetes bacterium]|nr:hypothetical protein [Bacteroidota bacterium]
ALAAQNNGYGYVHFEFVVAFASDVKNPYIAFVKASLGGRDLDKRADLPKVEKVFTKSASGFPTLRQMSGALMATLEIKPIDVETILRLFGNMAIRETGNLPSKKHGRGL